MTISPSTTVAVTGFSGYFGRVLWPCLRDDEAVGRVIGIDIRPPTTPQQVGDSHTSAALTFHQLDVRDTDRLAQVLDGADVVVHLAFEMMRLPRRASRTSGNIHERNMHIFHSTVQAALRARVRKLVAMSSVMAYGAWPDNPIPLTESSPLRPNPGLYYGRTKVAIEGQLEALQAAHPEMAITWLRPCTVVGPSADKAMMSMLNAPVMPALRGSNLPYQVVHEADLARAIHLVVRQDVTGVYNVAADDAPPVLDLVRETGGKVIPMSAFAIKALMALMWQAGKSVFAPEWIVLFQYPLVVSNEKLKALGWKPAHTSRSAFTALRSQSPAQNMPGGMPNTAAKDGQA